MKTIEIHGHRGARGIYPENSIEGFLYAINCCVNAIELDVVISGDRQVVVSHEPWFNHKICSKPNGEKVKIKEHGNLYKMLYSEIKKYDCGKKGNVAFPNQKKIPAYKLLLSEVIENVEQYLKTNSLPPVNYNIEIKSEPRFYKKYQPEPEEFIDLVMGKIKNIQDKCAVKSFDIKPLQILKEKYPGIKTGLLIANLASVKTNIEKLGFVPDYYNPSYKLIKQKNINDVRKLNMKILAWTVNEEHEMKRLIDLGVDGIITDYPGIALKLRSQLLKDINH